MQIRKQIILKLKGVRSNSQTSSAVLISAKNSGTHHCLLRTRKIWLNRMSFANDIKSGNVRTFYVFPKTCGIVRLTMFLKDWKKAEGVDWRVCSQSKFFSKWWIKNCFYQNALKGMTYIVWGVKEGLSRVEGLNEETLTFRQV